MEVKLSIHLNSKWANSEKLNASLYFSPNDPHVRVLYQTIHSYARRKTDGHPTRITQWKWRNWRTRYKEERKTSQKIWKTRPLWQQLLPPQPDLLLQKIGRVGHPGGSIETNKRGREMHRLSKGWNDPMPNPLSIHHSNFLVCRLPRKSRCQINWSLHATWVQSIPFWYMSLVWQVVWLYCGSSRQCSIHLGILDDDFQERKLATIFLIPEGMEETSCSWAKKCLLHPHQEKDDKH